MSVVQILIVSFVLSPVFLVIASMWLSIIDDMYQHSATFRSVCTPIIKLWGKL